MCMKITKPKLLTRDEFRNGVFRRDNHKCIVCGNTGQDSHHIMERRLFEDGGYYLENGATLCGACHIKAEQTLISPDQLYDILKVDRILPDDLYDEFRYTKWGDIQLANGTRLKGPLFFDESVSKILFSGNVLNLYSERVKYHRTFHLPFSESKTDDDRTLKNVNHYEGKEVVVTLKMDGEQSHIYSDGYFHARSIDGLPHHTQSFVRNLASKIGYELPPGWRISGENLYAKHSIKYENLESWFLMFALWDEKNICLSWDTVTEWASLLDLKTPKVIFRGIFDEERVRESFEPYKKEHEGYIVRLTESYPYGAAKYSIAKYVRKNHIQTSNHWKYERIEINGTVDKKNNI